MQYYACNVRRGERGEGGVERGWKVVEFVCVWPFSTSLSLQSVGVGTSKRGKKGAVAQARATRWPAVEVVWCWWWRAEGTHYSSD